MGATSVKQTLICEEESGVAYCPFSYCTVLFFCSFAQLNSKVPD